MQERVRLCEGIGHVSGREVQKPHIDLTVVGLVHEATGFAGDNGRSSPRVMTVGKAIGHAQHTAAFAARATAEQLPGYRPPVVPYALGRLDCNGHEALRLTVELCTEERGPFVEGRPTGRLDARGNSGSFPCHLFGGRKTRVGRPQGVASGKACGNKAVERITRVRAQRFGQVAKLFALAAQREQRRKARARKLFLRAPQIGSKSRLLTWIESWL